MKSPKEQLDSVYSSEPRHDIQITLESGEKYSFKSFNIPVKPGSTLGDKPIYFHPERMYVYSSYMGDQNHPIVQNLTFDPLVPGFEDLKSSTTVEK